MDAHLTRPPARGSQILAVDVGGTNLRIALVAQDGDRHTLLFTLKLKNSDLAGLEEGIARGMARASEICIVPTIMAVSAAGPVRGDTCVMTNIQWEIRGSALSASFGIPAVVMNDFTALCFSIPIIETQRRDILLSLRDPHDFSASPPIAAYGSMRAILGAGTGLGMGFLRDLDDAPVVMASEGGHADFAPFDRETEELWNFVKERHGGRAENEFFLSGRGIENIYDFLRASGRLPRSAATDRIDSLPGADKPNVISMEAHRGGPMAEVLNLFVRIYGRTAGNIAVTIMCAGGLYVAGGIAAKNPRFFTENGRFMNAFLDCPNENFRGILAAMPVFLVTDPDVALIGAANACRYLYQGRVD